MTTSTFATKTPPNADCPQNLEDSGGDKERNIKLNRRRFLAALGLGALGVGGYQVYKYSLTSSLYIVPNALGNEEAVNTFKTYLDKAARNKALVYMDGYSLETSTDSIKKGILKDFAFDTNKSPSILGIESDHTYLAWAIQHIALLIKTKDFQQGKEPNSAVIDLLVKLYSNSSIFSEVWYSIANNPNAFTADQKNNGALATFQQINEIIKSNAFWEPTDLNYRKKIRALFDGNSIFSNLETINDKIADIYLRIISRRIYEHKIKPPAISDRIRKVSTLNMEEADDLYESLLAWRVLEIVDNIKTVWKNPKNKGKSIYISLSPDLIAPVLEELKADKVPVSTTEKP